MARNVSESVKKRVAGKQNFKCANSNDRTLKGLEGFFCPLWQIKGSIQGIFNESGYEIDHIVEHSISHDDNENNLQALCLMCHSVKSKRFATNKAKNNSKQKNHYGSESSNETSEESVSENEYDMNGYIYVISTEEYAIKNKYIVEYRKEDKYQLRRQYQSYFINPIIFYADSNNNNNSTMREIKNALSKYKIENNSGDKTKWYNLELSKIIICICNITEKYLDSKLSKDNNSNENIPLPYGNWFKRCNPIKQFIEKCLMVTHKPFDYIQSSMLYLAYINSGGDAIPQKIFKEYFISNGFVVKKSTTVNFFGIKFKSRKELKSVLDHETIKQLIDKKLIGDHETDIVYI
jgi:hypothetical protein